MRTEAEREQAIAEMSERFDRGVNLFTGEQETEIPLENLEAFIKANVINRED